MLKEIARNIKFIRAELRSIGGKWEVSLHEEDYLPHVAKIRVSTFEISHELHASVSVKNRSILPLEPVSVSALLVYPAFVYLDGSHLIITRDKIEI